MIIPAYFGGNFTVDVTSLLSVMHESSKRVSETLQEIYSNEWDGHDELKAIVGVRAFGLDTSSGTDSCPHLSLIFASLSQQMDKQRSQSASFIYVASVTGGSKKQ